MVYSQDIHKCSLQQSQYRFLYHVLYEAFQSHGTVLSKDNFAKEVEYEMSSINAVKMSRLRKEFMVCRKSEPCENFFHFYESFELR